VADYVRHCAAEPGFDSQVLVTGLPLDFVEDPDLESSYRKVKNFF
jgi:hypothetical protein